MCMKKFHPGKFRRCCMDFPHNRSHLKLLVHEHFNILSIVGKIRQYEIFYQLTCAAIFTYKSMGTIARI